MDPTPPRAFGSIPAHFPSFVPFAPFAPRPATAEAAKRFLAGLASEITIQSTPAAAWAHSDQGGSALWGLYRAMSEPLRAAFRDGWTHFVARVPRAAAASAASVTDLIAEPEASDWFARFVAAAPWLDPETADLDGPAFVQLFRRRKHERRRRQIARRRSRLRGRVPSRPTTPVASTPPSAVPATPTSTTMSRAHAHAATMTLRELTKWLADLGETKQGGATLTVDAVRGRIRRPERASPEYAEFAKIRDPKSRRFPKIAALEILNRCAKRLGAERAEIEALAAAVREAKRLQIDGLQPRRAR